MRERELSHQPVYSPNASNIHYWTRRQPGVKNFIWLSLMDDMAQEHDIGKSSGCKCIGDSNADTLVRHVGVPSGIQLIISWMGSKVPDLFEPSFYCLRLDRIFLVSKIPCMVSDYTYISYSKGLLIILSCSLSLS